VELGVLFCDQVGSTALLTRLGDALAEEVRRDFFEALHQSVDLCRGEVVKGSGDGLMVIFRDRPADALLCGELMIRKVARLAQRELWSDVALRVGVTRGEAVFDRDDWYGAAVNLAARLCAAACTGQIVASAEAVDAGGSAVGWQPLDPMSLKGFPEPVPVMGLWVDCSDVPSWPTPVELDVQGAAVFVGRQAPMDALRAAWSAALEGGRREVPVSGAPGMGTSRLLAEFVLRHGSGAVVLSARGGVDPTAVGQLLRSYAAIATDSQLLDEAGPDAAALAARCPLIGLRLNVPPTESVESGDAVLARLLDRVSRRAPLIVLLDEVSVEPALAMPGRSLLLTAGRLERGNARPGTALLLDALDVAEIGAVVDSAVPARGGWRSELDSLIRAETDGIARDVVAIADALTALPEASGPSAAFTAVRRAVPYKGLQVFAGDDGVRFYGRERAVDEVMAGLTENAFVSVVGSSGSGKSSVVRAGCLPRLAAEGVQLIMTAPGEDPVGALAATWARATGTDAEALHQRLLVDPAALARAEVDAPVTVLVVDQLEEVFTLCADEQARDQYLRVVTHPVPGLRVLTTLRGDFYGRASEHPELAEALRSGTVLMAPATRAELRVVVESPAEAARLRLERGLSDLILTDITDRPGSLPLLSHALRETWRRRRGRTLTVADYREAGGATGAIARTADSIYEQLTDAERDIAKRIFLRLTALGEGVEDSRRRVPTAALAGGSEETRSVLQTLTAARLVTAGTDAEGRDVDELAHEALLREWPRLRGWLDEDRDQLRSLAHLEAAARDWDTAGRPETDLYAGRRLEAIESLPASRLNEQERDYLSASIARREAARRSARRARRRLQTFAVVVVVLLIVASIAGIVAVGKAGDARKQTRQARAQTVLATARGLSAQATTLQSTQPDLALLLAIEAQRMHDSADTRTGLLNALYASPHLDGVTRKFGAKLVFALSPDGRTAAVANGGDSFRLWDFASRTPLTRTITGDASEVVELAWSNNGLLAVGWKDGLIRVFQGRAAAAVGDPIHANASFDALQPDNLAISSNGKVLAAFDNDYRFERWSLPSGKPIGSLTDYQPPHDANHMTFDTTGARVAVGSELGTVRIIDTRTGKDLVPIIAVPGEARALGFSPDGTRLAVGLDTGVVVVVDTHTGREIGSPYLGQTYLVLRVAFSPNGKFLASTGRSGTVVVWRTSDGSVVGGKPFIGHSTGLVLSLAWASDSGQLTTSTPDEVITWDVADRAALSGSGQSQAAAEEIAFDPARHRIVVGSDDGRVRIWDSTTLKLLATSAQLADQITDIAIDPVTGTIAAGLQPGAVASSLRQEKVQLNNDGVDLLSPSLPLTVTGQIQSFGEINTLAFSPSGRQLAVVDITPGLSDQGLAVYDVANLKRPVFDLVPGIRSRIFGVAWSADGSRIFTGDDVYFSVTDVRTHRVLGRLKTPDDGEIESIEISPADHTVIIATLAGHIFRATPSGGATERPLLSNGSGLTEVAFSPDGKLIAGATVDGSLSLWSESAGTQLATSLPLAEGGSWVTFLDNNRLAIAGANDTSGIVELDRANQAAIACQIAGRNLTRSEFTKYLGSIAYHRTCPQWPAG
jgi:WD40 repeat protein